MIEGFRLSPQQKHLWARQIPFNAQLAILIEGPLDEEAIRHAFEDVVGQHEILKTYFRSISSMGVPLQVIDAPSLSWQDAPDLGHLSLKDQDREVDELLRAARQFTLNLANGPLIHASLIPMKSERHILTINLSAMHVDTNSLKRIVGEVAEAYRLRLAGEVPEVEEETPQYLDYSEWVCDLLESEEAEAGKAYWNGLDISEGLRLHLPLDKDPQPLASFSLRKFTDRPFSSVIVSKMENLAKAEEVTLPALCLSVWMVLLYRLARMSEIVVGTSFDGRVDEDLVKTIGPLVRYLPIEAHLRPEMTLVEVVRMVNQQLSEAHSWQECFSWEHLRGVDELDKHFFPVCFMYEERLAPVTLGDTTFVDYQHHVFNDQFEVKLCCVHAPHFLQISYHWDDSHVGNNSIHRLAAQFHTLMVEAFLSEEKAIGQLAIMPQSQRIDLLMHFNDTESPNPQGHIAELFEVQVERFPDKVALECEGENLTYRELHRRSDRLAALLAVRGIQPETFVGLCLPRSLDLVVSILAVLKAGGVYVPLSPDYPKENLSFILADCKASLVLTNEELRHLLPASDTQYLILEDCAAAPEEPFTPPALRNDHAAYIIYTSGSTGRPKGAVITHGVLADHCCGALRYYELSPEDRVLQFASFNFDASLEQFLPPLVSGSTVVVRGRLMWGSVGIDQLVKDLRLTVINFPTAYWNLLVREWHGSENPVSNRQLRLVIVGGEAMLLEQVRRWQETNLGRVLLINAYGPTETTITATASDVYNEDTLKRRIVSIGRPLPNRKAYVLDERMRLAPIGVVGELYLSGNLSRGYLHRPDMTAETFVPDPYASGPGRRLYRTGDMVRMLPELLLEYVGRRDKQLKIRGFRIEPREIEETLVRHPAITTAAVEARQDGDDIRLVAWYACEENDKINERALAEWLAHNLPDYMLPNHLVALDQFPMLPSGKINRKALPDPSTQVRQKVIGRRTPVEAVIADMWRELLGVDIVANDDNFFQLGGHSLLAMRLVSRIRKTFQIDMSLQGIFAAHNLSDMAATVAASGQNDAYQIPEMVPVPRAAAMPLSAAQTRLWLTQRMDPAATDFNVTAALELEGTLLAEALEKALIEIIRRHESMRTTFVLAGDAPAQVIHEPGNWHLQREDLSKLTEVARNRALKERIAAFATQPFDLATGPLVRAILIAQREKRHTLLFGMHHIISDGWSVGILSRELSALYEAFANAEPSPLPELSLQYADFAAWQNSWLQGEFLSSELAWWRANLAEANLAGPLPMVAERPAEPTRAAGYADLVIGAELTATIKRAAREEGATLFMILLAAFKALLHAYTGSRDLVVGTDSANRNRGEVESVIGFFINQLVIRTRLDECETFRDLVAAVRHTTLEAYAHQDLPFDKLVEHLAPKRDRDLPPIFQTKLVLQNAPGSKLTLSELVINTTPLLSPTAPLDLQMEIWEEDAVIAGMLIYNKDLYSEGMVARLLRGFTLILEQGTEHGGTTLMAIAESVQDRERAHAEGEREKRRQGRRDLLHSVLGD